jgi:predicted nuclease of restriction endonuclease-like RecB superfamily
LPLQRVNAYLSCLSPVYLIVGKSEQEKKNVRFSLQDVKRQIRRRDGELTVTLQFLRPGELRAEIARLVAYYEGQLSLPRKHFSQDEANACVGDYRLANCLTATLSAWYTWRQPLWIDVLNTLSAEARAALEAAEILSPIALRLALFDYVNARHSGFLDTQTRSAALTAFAALYALDLPRLEYLLALDTEDEAVLGREVAIPPEADAVATIYNQWVFEAALFNSSEVRFVIDCEAFLEAQRESAAPGAATGIGAVIKRLCFLARKLGVYYDLAYEDTLPGTRTTLLHLTLYGPQEMTGSAQHYGARLARLCRILMGFGLASASHSSGKRQAAAALTRAIRMATATVHVFQNTYRFAMEPELLALLPLPEPESQQISRLAETAAIYDSSVEQRFAEAFAALERGNGCDGWQLEREPEPLLLKSETGQAFAHGIFIPDFALMRGARRVYVEILGFWTPAYRERKLQKLQWLKGRTDLVLAVPVEARQVFAGLAPDFPLVEYAGQLSATDLLRVMQTRYDDFAERLSNLDSEEIHAQVRATYFIGDQTCYTLLHCYRRSELSQAAERVLTSDMVYTPGLGLYLLAWLERLHHSFVEWIEARKKPELSLSAIIQEWQARWPELAGCDKGAIETLLSFWPEVRIQHNSIFETVVVIEAFQGEQQAVEETNEVISSNKRVRERRAGTKKMLAQETNQQNLWE